MYANKINAKWPIIKRNCIKLFLGRFVCVFCMILKISLFLSVICVFLVPAFSLLFFVVLLSKQYIHNCTYSVNFEEQMKGTTNRQMNKFENDVSTATETAAAHIISLTSWCRCQGYPVIVSYIKQKFKQKKAAKWYRAQYVRAKRERILTGEKNGSSSTFEMRPK